MSNRRRSERFAIALPVHLKDARGGERTTTVDVSAHGIAVHSEHERPLRQYVELELELDVPATTISVTAVVARHADVVRTDTGEAAAGLGLDFFLFDAQAKAVWQTFIAQLHTRAPRATPRAAARTPPPPPPPVPNEDDDTPTFIIKPRDLGRLWAFFRGEMARGVVRIETPVLKPVGHAAELLVVHPTSQAEWVLEGEVVTAREAGRGGRPVLEIGLARLTADDKAAFRGFVATGRGQVEEDVPLDADTDDALEEAAAAVRGPARAPSVGAGDGEPDRIESVVIDLDSLDDPESGDVDGLRFITHPHRVPSGILQPDGGEEDVHEDEDPTQHTKSPISREFGRPASVPPPPPPPSAPAVAAPPASASAPPPPPSAPAAPPRVPAEERPTSVFASFFDEARAAEPSLESPAPAEEVEDEPEVGFDSPEITDEAEVDLSAASRARSHAGLVVPVDEDEAPEDEEPIPLVHRLPPRGSSGRAKRAPPPLPPPDPPPLPQAVNPRPASAPRRAVPAVPPSARHRQARRPSQDPSVKVGPASPAAPSIPVITGRRSSDGASAALPVHPIAPQAEAMVAAPELPPPPLPPRAEPTPGAQNPPMPPHNMYDFGDPSQRLEVPRPEPQPAPRPASRLSVTPVEAAPAKPERAAPRARRMRNLEEGQQNANHLAISTESADPTHARDLALARARVVRSPHSVTACYRLSTLLLQSSTEEGFDEAIRALDKVMALEPNHPGAHHKLAELFARKGDYTKAAEHLHRARRLGYQVDPDLEAIIAGAMRNQS